MHPIVVLIVDDEPLVRTLIADVLTDDGCLVQEAEDADSALGLLEADPTIQVMVADIRMPGRLDGVGLLSAARLLRPNLQVIVTSGAIAIGRRLPPQEALFLQKPFASDALSSIVRRLAAAGATISSTEDVALES